MRYQYRDRQQLCDAMWDLHQTILRLVQIPNIAVRGAIANCLLSFMINIALLSQFKFLCNHANMLSLMPI